MSEKLGYMPGLFEMERHIGGMWVCRPWETLVREPVLSQMFVKGLPRARSLAQVLVAKVADQQPMYRQDGIFERADRSIRRSTLTEWSGTCSVLLEPPW